jgi:hypothetical protein
VEARIAGLPRRFIELTLADPRGSGSDLDDSVRIPLDAIDADLGQLLELIRARAAAQRELSAAR